MTRYFLTRIRIEGFRGINNETDPLELKFQPHAVNSVFAVNGVGKSSIYEALNYAIRGVIPKLQDLLAQEHPDEYITNRFHSKATATIDLDFQPDVPASAAVTIHVERDPLGTRTVTSPSGFPDPDAFLAALDEDFTLLDYRTFTRFIDSSPLERGRSFSTLLGLSRYSDFRQALQSASDTRTVNSDFELTNLRTQIRAAEEAEQAALRRLQAAYEEICGNPLTDTSQLQLAAANVMGALRGIELIRPHVAEIPLKEIDFDTLRAVIKTAEGGEKRKELESLIESIATLDGIGAPDPIGPVEQGALKSLIGERDQLLNATPGELFKHLYDAADALIKGGEWTHPKQCPLCESALTESISDFVTKRLDQYSQVSAKADEIGTSCQTAYWLRRLDTLERLAPLAVPDDERLASTVKRRATEESLSLAEAEAAIAALTGLESSLTEALAAARNRKAALEQELPPSLVALTEQIGYAIQFRDALKDVQDQTAKKAKATATLAIRERWRDFIANAADAYATAEADLSRRKLAAIDSEYKTTFSRIMAVHDVVPELRRAGEREDLDVLLRDFHGLSNLSARALLSESYRNALAISVFLSAAIKHGGVPRFVILDDVTSSFDSGHQWNLMEAIRFHLQQPKAPTGLQFILLSHDGLLEKYFDQRGNAADWHHQKLQGYPPMGAVLSQAQDNDRLKVTATKLLQAGQVKEAQPLLRQYLEFKLLQIITRVQIPVPLDFAIKDHMKMVSNSLNAIRAAIELHKAAGTLILDPQQIGDLETIHVPALVGNWVTHYETAAGSSLAPPVLLGVVKTIDDFAECFRYNDTSGGAPQRRWYKSLSAR